MDGESAANRYRAFMSYSHKDAAAGRRLHRQLEHYVLPSRLVGRITARGPVPKRLAPIFRDREDLSAGDDLPAQVREGLNASACLIVVCSPAAKGSHWVEREISEFRSRHPSRPVLAAIVEGTPEDAFPAALLRGVDSAVVMEPLAADLRATGDGPRLGLLKLVAGLVGIGLDELIQRDAQRRLRSVTAVTAASLAAVVALTALTVSAVIAQREAERQRAAAEGLVEFMLTDLRDQLEGVGRLDVLTTVNRRALAYYEHQQIARLPSNSLERRARLLHAMGADDQTRGDLAAASEQFAEASRTTGALLAAAPDDPKRIWAHGQSEYWIGYVAYQRQERSDARTAFTRYRELSEQLIRMEPTNPIYLREAGYAEGNLCSLALSDRHPAGEGLRACKAALTRMEEAARHSGAASEYLRDLANRHGWLADAYHQSGDNVRARTQREAQEALLSRLTAHDPLNMETRQMWVALQRGLVALDLADGQKIKARRRLDDAARTLDAMIAHDPENARWATQRRQIDRDRVAVEHYQGAPDVSVD